MMNRGELKGSVSLTAFIFFCLNLNFFLPATPVYSEDKRESDPKYIFYKGNTLYEKGKYDEAVEEYSKLLLQGIESGNLYYNLGNCYFKKGELGKAILNYERAKGLMPRDIDLKSNYEFARSQIRYSVSETSTSRIKRVLRIFNILSINEMTILLSAVFVLTVLFLVTRIFIPVTVRYSLLFLSALSIVFVLIAFLLYSRVSLLDKEAIVISEISEVRFEPFENATTHFTLYEGMNIYVLQPKKDWVKIRRSDGKVGWIRNQDMEKI